MATTRSPYDPAVDDAPGNRGSSNGKKSNGSSGGNGRKKTRRKPTFWGHVRTFFNVIGFVLCVIVIAVCVAVYLYIKQAPKDDIPPFNPPGITMIYSSDGVPLAKYFTQNREVVDIDKIPADLKNATVAFEDRRFYEHHGIDFTGIARALWIDLRHGDMKGEGGSTITQQLARNLGVGGLTREKTINRKMKEWLIANQIEHKWSKEKILENYLNDVNYGSGAFGVEAAAKTYFGKHVWELDLAQCALLAGLPNRPTYFNPYRDLAAARRQRDTVLDNMLEEHKITPEQCSGAKAEAIKLAPHAPKKGNTIYRAPFFVQYAYEQLKQRYETDSPDHPTIDLDNGNIKVYTTLNWGMQQAAEDAVKEEFATPREHGPSQACLVAMDPHTGEIKAMVGGRDYDKNQFNIATQGRRQPGSLMKAVVYSAAIESGYSEDTTVEDSRVSYPMADGEDWTPKDDDGYSDRRVTLKEAMAMSINVPAVRVIADIKPKTVVQYARLMGISSPLDPVLSLALGSSAVTPLEMVDVYATFPNGGSHVQPIAFTRVTDSNDNVLDAFAQPQPSKILSQETVDQLNDMLRAVVTEGTAYRPLSIDPQVADAHGKTGTTQDHKDAWFIGYTPRLVAGIWAGHPEKDPKTGKDIYGVPMSGNAWGATLCVPIWRDFMLKAEPIFIKAQEKEAAKWKKAGAKPQPAPAPVRTADDDDDKKGDNKPAKEDSRKSAVVHNADGTVTVNIDHDTGLLAPPGAPDSEEINFTDGTQPTDYAPQYRDRKPKGADNNNDDSDSTPKSTDTPGNANGSAPPSNADGTPDTGQGMSQPVDTPISTVATPKATTMPPPAGVAANITSHHATAASQVSTGGGSTPPTTAVQSSPPQPSAPPRRRRPPPEYVTVYINPDDGLLATEWDPEKVARTYVKGHEPKHYSTEYPPPPGER